MASRQVLTVIAAALGCALAVTTPASSQVVIDGKDYGDPPSAGVEYGTPAGEGNQTEAVPKELPQPPPNGCPYRERKLDLIV